jgi:hypothetical protein
LTVDANTTKYLAVRYSWISGYSYQAKLVSSKDNAFLYTATAPISDVSDALPIPVLYKANVNFYVVGNVKKIDLDIGNSGISDTNITHVYIGTSASTLQNQTITPVAVRAGADPSRITVNYDWTAGSTYYFKVIFSSGQSLDWPEQTPSDGTGFESQEITVVRTEPENITVNVGDEFNVSVLIENVPPDNGMAGVQFTVNWDETVLKGIDLNEVLFHSAAAPEEQDNIWSLRNFVNDSSAESACLWLSAQRTLEAGYTPFSGNRTLAILVLKALKTGATTIHFSVVKIGNSDAQPLVDAFNGEVNGLLKNVIIDGHVTVTDKELATRAPSENNETTYDQSSVPKTVFNENSGGFNPAETIVTFSAGFATALAAISVFHVAHRKKKPIDGR